MDFVPVNVYSLLSVRRLYSIYHLTFSKGYSYPGESHNFWELGYLISGCSGATSGDAIYRCSAGDAVLHAPNQFHSMWVDNDMPCEMFMISFDGTGFEHRLPSGKYTLLDNEKSSIDHILQEIPRLFSGYDLTEFTRLFSTSSPDNVGYQIIKSHLELICLSLIRRGEKGHGISFQRRTFPMLCKDSSLFKG